MSVPHPPTLGASPVTPESMIARLQRDARDDPRLAAIPPTTRDQSIERAVQELWATSRVKTFLPVLALRQARAALDDLERPTAGNDPDPNGGAHDAASRRAGAADDEFALPADDVLDLADDVM